MDEVRHISFSIGQSREHKRCNILNNYNYVASQICVVKVYGILIIVLNWAYHIRKCLLQFFTPYLRIITNPVMLLLYYLLIKAFPSVATILWFDMCIS